GNTNQFLARFFAALERDGMLWDFQLLSQKIEQCRVGFSFYCRSAQFDFERAAMFAYQPVLLCIRDNVKMKERHGYRPTALLTRFITLSAMALARSAPCCSTLPM